MENPIGGSIPSPLTKHFKRLGMIDINQIVTKLILLKDDEYRYTLEFSKEYLFTLSINELIELHKNKVIKNTSND